MPQIKRYIFAIIILFNLNLWAQKSIEEDPEIIQNSINYKISQSELDISNFDYFEAQKKLDDALDLAIKAENNTSIGIIYSKKGKLHLIIEEQDQAIKSLNEAIKVQRTNDNANLGNSYKTLGEVYLSKKDYNQAIDYFTSAKNLFQQEGLNKNIAETLLLEGATYLNLENYKKARELFDQSIQLSKKENLPRVESNTLVKQANVYFHLGDNPKAVQLANEGIAIAKTNKFPEILSEGYSTLSEINQSIGDYQTSNNYLRAFIKLSDSLRTVKKANLSPDKRIQSLMSDQIAKNKQTEEELVVEKNKNELSTLISILSVALITILSLLTLSLYKNNNIRLKTNNMLHKKNAELIVAKEKAELASKTKANFLSTVTHELRTPLYAVTGLSNMLLDENPKPEQIQHLKSLKFSGDYLLAFINDILQINKIEANKVELEPEPFNLKKKINNIILALNNSAQDNNVKIHFEYDNHLQENYIADQLKISQILINLIGNSIKFTKDGDIWIRVYKIEQQDKFFTLRFEVEDNGIGISEDKQENMFESFSQGSIQINRKYGGTGLGLSIVKGLIDILKGKIFVKSELGKGTTFYFEIPLENTEQQETDIEIASKKETPINKSEDLDLSNVKILVVEDNKINQMITKKILTKMELKCDIVDNGEGAVDMIKNNQYDIILMDIHMPGISGIEATKIVRSFDKELTIFALTAVTIEDKMQEFEEAGFTDIIPKPFKQEEFEKKLYNALSKNSNGKSATA
ncbi:response regulator [Flavobacteriaceae bacterium XHP0103]|uniref:ATP-binding protein n=1 Tax=Marixanthotalea marina TaxID=2844359 RepID=UPI002989EB4F|nr:ATP-binding protein [Marixanthotalea marina]MBU3821899.1 response regulator [Marixanthotalea marina]